MRKSDILEIARGMCILLVVFGHAITNAVKGSWNAFSYVFDIIYFFHMPVFFFISGYLFEKKKNKYFKAKRLFIRTKAKLLLIPYISLSIIIYTILYLLQTIPVLGELLEGYGYQIGSINNSVFEILTYEGHLAKHLWFLPALFIIFLIEIGMNIQSVKGNCIIIAICLIALPIIKSKMALPLIIDYTIFELPFFHIGRIIASKGKLAEWVFKTNVTVAVFPIMILIYYVIDISSFYIGSINPIRIIILFTIRCSGLLATISVCAFFYDHCVYLCKAFLSLGSKSFCIYLLHQPFIVSGSVGVLMAFGVGPLVFLPIVTVLGVAIPIIINNVMKDNRLYKIFILGGH